MSQVKNHRLEPTKYITLGFLAVIIIGALLLTTPLATKSGKSVGFLNAFFTSTSAVCVTGLVVVDTATTWNLFGRIVIMTLIQIGGLGFMSIATLIPLILNKKIDLKDRLILKEQLNQSKLQGIVVLLKKVFAITFAIELLGAAFLSLAFVPRFGFIKGLGYGIFHSISAFCNAGFDLFGGHYGKFSSITGFSNSPYVLLTISTLIILGGIGFPVIINLINHFKDEERISLHSKIALTATGILLVFGTIIFFALEYNNPTSLGHMGFVDKVTNSFLQSTTTRTAGFASVDMSRLREGTLFMMIILMFIGASPASTGGGIKTVTLVVLIMNIHSIIKGSEDVNIFKRRLQYGTVRKAIAIFLIAMIFVLAGTFIMVNVEPEYNLLSSLFECTSAIATVGCSIAGSQYLTSLGKILISIFMFAGRVGMITLFISMAGITLDSNAKIKYPEENILIG
uniref:TrkH family potassium uptake protein n=1 Tax=Ezakiella massiliensis TaxID=1852374 RepID=UPI00094E5027|nr:TrkH family potassium uptake protein [Ezakiella massiliensis]